MRGWSRHCRPDQYRLFSVASDKWSRTGPSSAWDCPRCRGQPCTPT